MVNEDYWKKFHQTQSLILEMLYELDLKNFIPYLDKFPDNIAKEYKQKIKEEIDKNIYNHAYKNLIQQKLIEVVKFQDIRVELNIQKKRDYVRITVKGTTRVIQKRLAVIVDDAKQSIDKVEQKIEKRIETTREYMDDVKKEVTIVKNDTERIEKEFKREQNRFYAKLIEIFGIFVVIFSFIIVGFNEISSTNKITHIVIIFILLVLILLILLWAVGRVVKSINKPIDENNKPTQPNAEPTFKAFTNWLSFSVFCFIAIINLVFIGIIFRISDNLYWLIIQAFIIITISLFISYSTWHDDLKEKLWNARVRYMLIILVIQFVLMLVLAYFTMKSLGTI